MAVETEDEVLQDEKMPELEELPEITVVSHSALIYWWPVWLAGFVLAFLTGLFGETVSLSTGREIKVLPSTLGGTLYVTILLFVTFVTNVRMRGMISIGVIMAAMIVFLLLGWAGWLDELAMAIPELSVHLNLGFLLVTSSVLFVLWAAMVFVFDRFTVYRIRPGQMTELKIIGSAERSFDTRGMLFEQRSDDIFRHNILGFGAGDLVLLTSGGRQEDVKIYNVLNVEKKVNAIQKLVAVQPDELLDKD